MLNRIGLSLVAAIALATPASALQADGGPLDFDLVRINSPGHPLDPGITYEYQPVSSLVAEATGVSTADFNNDGFYDLLFCGTEGRPNELYVNNQDGTFTEGAVAFGVDEPTKRRGNSLFFDYDNDGDNDLMTFGYPSFPFVNLDLYSFFRNNGPEAGYTFTDATLGVGGFALGPTVETTTKGEPGGAAAADFDNDGYIDVVVTYWFRNNQVLGYSDDQFRLWHNVPNPAPDLGQPDYSPRLFVDATASAGLDGLGIGWIWQPSWHDFNRDGFVDLHINVEGGEDLLLLNDGDGTFTDADATSLGLNFNGPEPIPGGAWGHEMGKAIGDFDNDGDMDLYLTNPGSENEFKKDAFYRNDSDLSDGGSGLDFTYIGELNGVTTNSDLIGWGAAFNDLDNDGDQDLLTARGLQHNVAPNTVWMNEFPLTTGVEPVIVWTDVTADVEFSGLSTVLDTARALTILDFDNDGDFEAVTTRSGNSPQLPTDLMDAVFYLNTSTSTNNWVQVDTVEMGGSLSTTGARVYVRTGGPSGVEQMDEVQTGGSFLAQEPSRLHFGLGTDLPDYLAVRWNDGRMTAVSGAGGPLNGLQTVTRSLGDNTGDLDQDGDCKCADLELFTQGLIDDDALDAMIPATWPWRVLGDMDGNGLLDNRDLLLMRLEVRTSWCDLGNGLAGALGTPQLTGTGLVAPGLTVGIDLTNAKPNAPAFLFMGLGVWNAPLYGGTLIPSFDLPLVVLVTDGSGEISLSGTWPLSAPTDLLAQLQYWVAEGPGPFDFAASNGLSARTQ